MPVVCCFVRVRVRVCVCVCVRVCVWLCQWVLCVDCCLQLCTFTVGRRVLPLSSADSPLASGPCFLLFLGDGLAYILFCETCAPPFSSLVKRSGQVPSWVEKELLSWAFRSPLSHHVDPIHTGGEGCSHSPRNPGLIHLGSKLLFDSGGCHASKLQLVLRSSHSDVPEPF